MTLDNRVVTEYTEDATFDDLVRDFRIQPELHPEFWDGNKRLHPEVRMALLKIARAFYDGIELPNKPKIRDIVFTGSLANYNYSDQSDVDIHLLFDFGTEKATLTQFFLLAKSRWNDAHDVTVKGYDVEVYAEDESAPHVATGLFSILRNRWIKEPVRERPVVDIGDVKTKTKYFIGRIVALQQEFNTTGNVELLPTVERLKEKIAKFRQSGLKRGGEFSVENLTFKLLRRMGYMEILSKLQTAILDTKLSLDEYV
jgi:hypothetical protein